MKSQHIHEGLLTATGLRISLAVASLLLLMVSSQIAVAQLPPAGGGGAAECRATGASGAVADPATGGHRLGGLGRTTCYALAPCQTGAPGVSEAKGEAWSTLGAATAFLTVEGSAQAPFNCSGGPTQAALSANASYSVSIAQETEPPGGWPGVPVPVIVRAHLTADFGDGGASLTITGLGANWVASSDGQPDLTIIAELDMMLNEIYGVSMNASCVAGVGFQGGVDLCKATADPTFEFDQDTFDAVMGDDTFPLANYLTIDYSENLVATPLGVDVIKLTNFNRADEAYDANVPQVPVGEPVTWTYDVANMGETAIAATDLLVTDSDPVVIPILDLATDDGDLILSPLETWEYTASVPALDLATSPPGITIVTGCGDGRNTYENTGWAEIAGTGIFDEHVSHYCNDVAVLDSDGDGIRDEQDNCIEIANGPVIPDAGGQSQHDADGDGYGNACDPDLDNNGIVNFLDLPLWIAFFDTPTTGIADFNGDGVANFLDYALYPVFIFQPPGPSGVAP